MRVAILGGTGSFGGALAARLVAAGGHDVVIGSRDAARAEATAAELGGGVSGATNDDAVRNVELAVLAVKADAALETVFNGKKEVDMFELTRLVNTHIIK